MFQFACPAGHLLEGEESQAGQQCDCPMCGVAFVIPAPVAPTVSPLATMPAVPTSAPPAAQYGAVSYPVQPAPPSPQPPQDEAPESAPPNPFAHIEMGGQASPKEAAPPTDLPGSKEVLFHIPCPLSFFQLFRQTPLP